MNGSCRWIADAGRHVMAAAFVSIFCLSSPALAQPVIDRLVSDAQVVTSNGCSVMTVVFNTRVRYTGHFPQDRGDELLITLQPINRDGINSLPRIRREGVNLIGGDVAGVNSVTAEMDIASGPSLRIQFSASTSFRVSQYGSFENLIISFAKPGSGAQCRSSGVVGLRTARADQAGGGKISPADFKIVEASMDEARAALKKGKVREAKALLEKVLRYPHNEHSDEARDLLAGMQARSASAAPSQEEKQYADYLLREGQAPSFRPGPVPPGGVAGARTPVDRPAKPDRTPEGSYSMSGSVSTFFVRNDSINQSKDISIAPDPNADPDAHRVHQNTVLTNIDIYGTVNSDVAKSKFKIAGTDENQAGSSAWDTNRYGISTAYWETTLRETDIMARIGRQTRNTGGVIGRFDGAVLSWGAYDKLRLNAVAGAANWSRFDLPFKDSRLLFGTSVDIMKMIQGLDVSLFVIQQTDRGLLDRRAVGAEFRYFDKNKSALGTIDYDIHFGKLNAGIFSGTWTFDDKSVLAGGLDYRRVPYLSTWNALQGQPYLTLYDMLKYATLDDLRRFALDRTPVFKSAMASYSRPITENLQASVDATVTQLSGTPPSGGVDGTFPSGTEYYVSGTLMATNMFKQGDMFVGALRYAHLADSRVYFLDLNSRYPIMTGLSIAPRFRAGLRTGTTALPLREWTVLPSLLFDYTLAKDLVLEGELGTKVVGTQAGNVHSTTKDLYVTLGLRSNFTNEGAYKCAGVIAPCVALVNGPARGPDVAKQDAFYNPTGLFAARPPAEGEPAPDTTGYVLEVGARFGTGTANNAYDYFSDLTPTERVSRLSYSNLAARAGEVFFRFDIRKGLLRNVFLKGYVGGGNMLRGSLYDEDFPPFIDYSKTVSTTSGKLRYGVLDVGYNFFTTDRIRLGAFVGYHGWLETVHARGCTQIGGNPFVCAPAIPAGVLMISERDRWNTARFGTAVDINITNRLSLSAEFAMTSVRQRSLDTHYFTFGNDPGSGPGSGFETEGILKYRLTDNLSVGVGGRWWRAQSQVVDAFGQLLQYRMNRFGAFGQASYRFDFGNTPAAVASNEEK